MGHFGILSYLHSCDLLGDVRDWYGCSAGSYCALVGALGCSSQWIRDLVQHLDISAFAAIEEDTVINFLDQYGVTSGSTGMQLMKRFIDTWEPGISKWTFADLSAKRPGITLTIIATNLTEGRLKLFSATETPDVLIFDAIRASCAVPFFFTPSKDTNGDLLCDGAALEVYPWSSVVDKARTLVVVCSDTEISGRKPIQNPIRSVGDYLTSLMNLMMKSKSSENPRHWIAVNNSTIGFLDFHITAEKRMLLFEEGVAAATGWNEFRKKVLSAETREIHLPSAGRYISSSSHPSQSRMLGSPQSYSLPRPPYPSQGSRSEGPPHGRRWSL